MFATSVRAIAVWEVIAYGGVLVGSVFLGAAVALYWRALRRYVAALNRLSPDEAGSEPSAPRRYDAYHWTPEGGWRPAGDPGPERPEGLVRPEADIYRGI